MKQTTQYFRWPQNRNMITGYYDDPAAEKKRVSETFFFPNIVLVSRDNGNSHGRMSC